MALGKENDKLGKEIAKLQFGIRSLQKAHSSQDRLNQQANLAPVKEEVLGEDEDDADSDEEMQKAAVTAVVSIAQTVIGHMCGENNSIEVLGEHVKTVTDHAKTSQETLVDLMNQDRKKTNLLLSQMGNTFELLSPAIGRKKKGSTTPLNAQKLAKTSGLPPARKLHSASTNAPVSAPHY